MIGWIPLGQERRAAHLILAVIAAVGVGAGAGCGQAHPDEGAGPPSRLDAGARARVLGEVGTAIRDHYADREVGRALADTLQARLQQGRFDTVEEPEQLIEEVMAVIRAGVPDRHFDFSLRAGGRENGRRSRGEALSEHGLRTIRVLEDDIAYLEFDGLPGEDEAMSYVERSLAALPAVQALIIDVRHNIGGSGDMVTLLCSHLLPAGTFLYDYRDRSGDPPGEVRTVAYGRVFGPEVPVYVLTGDATLSAAEALAFLLQDSGRARIVGQQTPGMANPSRTYPIGDDFAITIPFVLFGYGENRTTYAGVGVVPDSVVPVESALDVALAEIRGRVP